MRRLAVATLAILTVMLLFGSTRTADAAPAKVRAQFRIVEHTLVDQAKNTIEQASVRVSAANSKEDSRSPRIYWSNGKKGSQGQLNTTKLMKSGAVMNISPIQDEMSKTSQQQARYTPRRWASNGKKGSLKLLNITMLIKGGALSKPSAIQQDKSAIKQGSQTSGVVRRWMSNGKKASINQLNIPMLVKGGALGRVSPMGDDDNPIRVNRQVRRSEGSARPGMIRPKVFKKPPKNLNHTRLFRRETVGRFCTGRSCER